MKIRLVEAVIFDMDGTLVDSEPLTVRAIEKALSDRGVPMDHLHGGSFHGVTWASIATRLSDVLPEGSETITASELQENFRHLHHVDPPPLVPGALEALGKAKSVLPVAICTSSNRESLQDLLGRINMLDLLEKSVCAEDCTRSKPDPQGYLLAASRLGVAPERCLVFEDSVAGVQAARSAGMEVVSVTGCSFAPSEVAAATDNTMVDFRALPAGFFEEISRGAGA